VREAIGLSRPRIKALGIYPLTFHTDLPIVTCEGKINFVTQTGAEGIMRLEALNPISHFEGWGFLFSRFSGKRECSKDVPVNAVIPI
jgi:hypothetical protein